MLGWLFLAFSVARAEEYYLEAPPVTDRSAAARMELTAEAAGFQARIVRRFRLGKGWEFVVLVERFPTEAEAGAAATRLERELSGKDAVAQEYPHDAAKCFLLSGRSFFDTSALDRLEACAAAPLAPSALPTALAELVDPAGVLVAQGERGSPGEHAVTQHVHEVKVGVAGTGAGDLDDDLAGAGRGDGDLGDDGIAVPGLEL